MKSGERNQLFLEYQPMARRLARRYFYKFSRLWMTEDDWYQECCLAMLLAIETFEGVPSEGYLWNRTRRFLSRNVIDALFRSAGRGGSGEGQKRINAENQLPDNADDTWYHEDRNLELLEVAIDVQRLVQSGTPLQQEVLRASLADSYIAKGKSSREGRRMTVKEMSAKAWFIRTMKQRLGVRNYK